MSSGHDNHDNHSNEPKKVAFRTPMILALVTVLAIVLLVSTCDHKKCCEDGTKCEAEHGGHEQAEGEEHIENHEAAATGVSAMETAPMADSTAAKPDTAAAKADQHGAHH